MSAAYFLCTRSVFAKTHACQSSADGVRQTNVCTRTSASIPPKPVIATSCLAKTGQDEKKGDSEALSDK